MAATPGARVGDFRELLARLVAVDTTSEGSNLGLLELVTSLLDRHGVAHHVAHDPTGTKANLVARIGPEVEGGVVLCGHTDCVPVEPGSWSHDPFGLQERGGRLYGRGTADMKGFVAVALSLLGEAVAAELRRPLLLVLTHDEELGALGAPSAVHELLEHHPRPEAVLVGEPTGLEPVDAHKGVRVVHTTVEGLDGHSSRPDLGANAVTAAARIAVTIEEVAHRHREQHADPRFDPPHTTFNVGLLRGGQAVNVVPGHAELVWEYRPVPDVDADAVLAEVEGLARERVLPTLRRETGAGNISFTTTAVAPGLRPEPSGRAEMLVRELTGFDGPTRAVSFATDAGHFQAAGLSTVVWGPGSIEQAHRPDEWIEVAQLERLRTALRHLLRRLSA